jgi:hypothetical protein
MLKPNIPNAVWALIGGALLASFVFAVAFNYLPSPTELFKDAGSECRQSAINKDSKSSDNQKNANENLPTPERNKTEPNAADVSQEKHTYDCLIAAYTRSLSDFTKWLVFVTALLGVGTAGLVYFALAQFWDTRILQRGYISVKPMGVESFIKGPFYSCDVSFENVGHLPARNVRWFIDRVFDDDRFKKDLPIVEERFEGNNVISPGTEMRKGGNGIEKASFEAGRLRPGDSWLYVWGEVRYNDGFGTGRFTKFCHRYNMAAARERRKSRAATG